MGRKSLFELINNAKKEEKDYASEFLTDLTYSIEKWDKINEHESSKTISPSSMKCFRAMVFKLMGKPKDKEKRSYQLIDICANGSSRHEALQQMIYNMKNLGIDCDYVNVKDYVEKHKLPLRVGKASDFDRGEFETHLYSDKYCASFLCDGMLKYKGKYFILEIKTESASKFMKQKDVMEEHKNQATAYSLFLGIPDVMFLYENRDLLNKKVYVYTPTKQDKHNLECTILDAIKHAKDNKIPDKPVDAGKELCKYCSYKEVCDEFS